MELCGNVIGSLAPSSRLALSLSFSFSGLHQQWHAQDTFHAPPPPPQLSCFMNKLLIV